MSTCPKCSGKGGMGTFGPVCAGDTFYQRPCPFCKGACRINAMTSTKCIKCNGMGGEGTFGPCEVGDVHFKKNCDLCVGEGFLLGSWTFIVCTVCAGKGGRTSAGSPCDMGSVHFASVCPACFGKGYSKNPVGMQPSMPPASMVINFSSQPMNQMPMNPTIQYGMPMSMAVSMPSSGGMPLPPNHPMNFKPTPAPDVAAAFYGGMMPGMGMPQSMPGMMPSMPPAQIHIHQRMPPSVPAPIIVNTPPPPVMGMGGSAVVLGGFSAVGPAPIMPGHIDIHIDTDRHRHHHGPGFRHHHHHHHHHDHHHGPRHGFRGGSPAGVGFQNH